MPIIFDNITKHLLPTLRESLSGCYRTDICVGYFNLRGWRCLQDLVENFDGSEQERARVLIGMHQSPDEEMRRTLRIARKPDILDGPTKVRLRRTVTANFREQIDLGVPSDTDEDTLRRLAHQIRLGKLQVKLFLRHPLHAKLYLGFRHDHAAPILGYVGSSNLTSSGLSKQGELNVDVLEQDAAQKLSIWFEDRWNDSACVDISDELAALIETSWAREDIISPYLVYLKMVYHLAQEAREGEREFKMPKVFRGELTDFQAAAVSLAVRHLNSVRGGVLIGDVVGLGKTRVGSAIAKIYEEDQDSSTLILCPKNLVGMWEQQIDQYDLKAEVLSLSKVQSQLSGLKRFKIVMIDESHNLRNREGKRYQVIRDYIERNDSRVVLLTATPYNKQYGDLGNQLRLFVDEKRDLGVRPERFFQNKDEREFAARFQAPARSLTAFEKSEFPEDWRDLMRLFMVRRTRQFIIQNYAQYDAEKDRFYVAIEGGRSYFPKRQPLNFEFALDEADPEDQFAHLYQNSVVDMINALCLPRYGLGNYVNSSASKDATPGERRQIDDLGKAGPRLMGFCRTNLFKRLESSGHSFLLSVDRHILRNMVTLHALETGQALPIGTQESGLIDASQMDTDPEATIAAANIDEIETDDEYEIMADEVIGTVSLDTYGKRAAQVYEAYRTLYPTRFKWLLPKFFQRTLISDLKRDADQLLGLIRSAGPWRADRDAKLEALQQLLCETHPTEKVLVFTQFADSALYIGEQLTARGVRHLGVATAQYSDPTALARRFSPQSNRCMLVAGEQELRVMISTDSLSEGQNLQDAAIIVNWDLPWAIIRLIQRAGRVDRIGQKADTIQVYSFLPAAGVERVIGLQKRLTQRLLENHEVVGADEAFFDEVQENAFRDLYTEKSSALENDGAQEVDLESAALQVWKNALKVDPSLKAKIEHLPNVVFATKPHGAGRQEGTAGVLVYLKTDEGADALVRLDQKGQVITQSLSAILHAAECPPNIEGLPRHPQHHELVKIAVEKVLTEQVSGAGALGAVRSARRRAYDRLTTYRQQLKIKPSLFVDLVSLDQSIQALYQYPLTNGASDQINRQLRTGISDQDLAQLVNTLQEEDRLSVIQEAQEPQDPMIVCSLGMFPADECVKGDE